MYVIDGEHALVSEASLEESRGIEQCKKRGLNRHVENTISMIKKWKKGQLSDYYKC